MNQTTSNSAAGSGQPAGTNSAQAMIAENAKNRMICIQQGVPARQQIASITQATHPYVAGQATTINIPITNVGLIRRFYVEVTATVAQSAAETHTRTTFGPANFFSRAIVTDLNNLTRINTAGWHLTNVAAARRSRVFGGAYTTDTPLGIGSNYGYISAPASFTTAQTVKMMYELPMAYSDNDLRGAIWANVVNATMNLQLTINPNFSVASTADPTLACYQSSTTDLAQITGYTIKVYQDYLDQIPQDKQGAYMLPMIDLATQYNLLDTSLTGIAANTDFPLPYANFRSYYSTFVIYDNGGSLNAGTDVNYMSLATANSLNLFKDDPYLMQLMNGRNRIGGDWQAGCYYFDHRTKPLTTLAFGNMNLNLNASSVGSNSIVQAGYEFFALVNQLQQAGSIGLP